MPRRHNLANRGQQAGHSLLPLPDRCRATQPAARRAREVVPKPTDEMLFSYRPSTDTPQAVRIELRLARLSSRQDVSQSVLNYTPLMAPDSSLRVIKAESRSSGENQR